MRIAAAILLVSVVAFSCARGPELSELVKDMLVFTQYNTEEIDGTVNIFNTYSTFTLKRDTIGYVCSCSRDTILVDGTAQNFVKPVVNEVRQNILNRGFTLAAAGETPDFAVNIVVLRNFSFFQTVSYPGYYSGYYGYYGYYYPIVNSYYSDYATLVVEVVNVKDVTDNKYEVIWKASIGDLLTTTDMTQNALEAINQAFQQSPYFSKN